MRVLQINSVCGIGSTGRIATDIHNVLTEQGHESYIAYGRHQAKNCNNAIKIGSDLDNYLHVAKTRVLDKHGFGSKKATLEFIKKIKKIDPDIIHLHNIHGYYINIEVLFEYLRDANKPVVWTLHDCWSFTGHCSSFDYIGCDKWKSGCFQCPQKNEYPESKFIDNSKINYYMKKSLFTAIPNLTIITPSVWLKDLLQESFFNTNPIHVIHNGIDLNVFKPSKNTFREDNNLENKFIILGVANVWGPRKGLEYFVKLSNSVKKNEQIILVGVTEKQKKNLPKNIIGITRTYDLKELVNIYSSADIFLNPTLEDNFPTVNLEALACGLPVFTFDTGGSTESIDNFSGKVIDKTEVFHLNYEQENIFNKEECRHRALEFEKNKQFQKYINLYKEINS